MPSSFTQENFLKFLPIWVYVKQVTPTTGLRVYFYHKATMWTILVKVYKIKLVPNDKG